MRLLRASGYMTIVHSARHGPRVCTYLLSHRRLRMRCGAVSVIRLSNCVEQVFGICRRKHWIARWTQPDRLGLQRAAAARSASKAPESNIASNGLSR